MRTLLCRTLMLIMGPYTVGFGQSAASTSNPAIQPYVEFLRHQNTAAKDYILNLFERHDVVILCERDHRDITQYNLFLSIIRDERFINTVGNVFTEIGVSNLNPHINEFLHTSGLSADSVQKAILHFHRNCSHYPLWEKWNFSYFLNGLYNLNQGLPPEKMIDLYPSDMSFDWSTVDSAGYKKFWDTLGSRDSIMALQIIQKVDEIQVPKAGRRKALVIMNYRHAFGHRFEFPVGRKPNNVGRFLFERFGEKVANVLINGFALANVRSDNDVDIVAIQDGKWDAAFKALDKEDAGFDFLGSPFGKDYFDIWPFKQHPFTYDDVFTGFVFYLPLEKHKCVVGIPGIIDSAFAPEMERRQVVFNKVLGRGTSEVRIDELKSEFNNRREFSLDVLDSLSAQIARWLQ